MGDGVSVRPSAGPPDLGGPMTLLAAAWGSLVLSLLLAGLAAFPANRWLIRRGRGHAVIHQFHGSGRHH